MFFLWFLLTPWWFLMISFWFFWPHLYQARVQCFQEKAKLDRKRQKCTKIFKNREIVYNFLKRASWCAYNYHKHVKPRICSVSMSEKKSFILLDNQSILLFSVISCLSSVTVFIFYFMSHLDVFIWFLH